MESSVADAQGLSLSPTFPQQQGNRILVSLVRHGQSDYNLWRQSSFSKLRWRDILTFDPGIVDAPLSPAGIEQTRKLAAQLPTKEPALCRHVSMIISSPLSRAVDTALTLFTPREPNIDKPTQYRFPRITLLPLATEWLSTKSDTGSSLNRLKEKYAETWDRLDDSSWKTLRLREDVWWYSYCQAENNLMSECREESESRSKASHALSDGLTFPNNLFRLIAPEPQEMVAIRAEALKSFIATAGARWIAIVGHAWFFRLLTGESKMHNCEIRHYQFDVTERQFSRLLREVDILRVIAQDGQ